MRFVRTFLLMSLGFNFLSFRASNFAASGKNEKPQVIITTDGEIDDECSMVRCLLYANDWDIEGIVTSSSQYHWHGHKWAGDDWMDPYLDAYEKVYPNLVQQDKSYPTPQYLRERTVLGNVSWKARWMKLPPARS